MMTMMEKKEETRKKRKRRRRKKEGNVLGVTYPFSTTQVLWVVFSENGHKFILIHPSDLFTRLLL